MDTNITYYPLTHPQKGIWYTDKLYPGTSIATISATLKFIDYELLEKAIILVINKIEEINHNINCITRVLRNKGVKANINAGLFVARPIEMLAMIFSVHKSGGTYLPDPFFPLNRIVISQISEISHMR